ncbi:arginine/agmatine antiporter [Paraburkholderia silviterrae]|uniref:Arginine/agmatine antiporter n=1 Tax=Paraburkholderia silviterrae TaxID=2528715 RepID=A0A4R5MEM0_9BURK|nr:arginine/agmatine antiporter [Paraburkholderia silviterrae]TDG25566.1 arginine/agmatine antiporter [Paraburkholderia silviterrae]
MSNAVKKVGVVPATLMVAGNIMGSGVFMLPANLAATGGIAIFGWLVTITGAVALALVYAKMSSIDPAAGGSYAFARKAFGPFAGYQVNMLYWLSAWVGNIAIVVVGVGYLSFFIPALKSPLALTLAGIAVLWLFVFVNILGPTVMTKVQSVTTLLALVPIVGVAIIGWFWFKPGLYMSAWNVSGHSTFTALQSTLNVTLWSFIGVETAAVSAAVVENPKKNVPIATIGGVLIAAVSYVLSTTAIMGIIPNHALQASASPFGDAVRIMLGESGGAIVALCAALGCLGSLGGWILVTAQTAKAAADDRLFSPIFGKVNSKGVPVAGLVIVGILMTIVQLTSISPNASKQFGVISSVSVIFTLVPYIYTCAALLVLGHGHLGSSKRRYAAIMCVAFGYSLWAIVGSDQGQVLWSFVVVLATTALYALSYNRTHPAAFPLDESPGS